MGSSRNVLITGAAGALGQTVLARFLAAGDSITAVGSPNSAPPSTPGVEWVQVDLTDGADVRRRFATKPFDVVVHCAGGFRWSPVESLSYEDFQFLMRVNFESAFHLAAAVVPAMKKKKNGVLLFVSSIATQVPAAGMSAYAASKGAINAFVTNLAVELQGDGIRVNAILPGIIDTPANRRDMPKADFSQWIPREQLAETLLDLSLEKSASTTGALIQVTGRN